MDPGTIALISFGGIIALIIIWFVGVSIYNKSHGTISIVLDKYQFTRGDKITGKITVNLKKVIHAEKLTVSLKAVKDTMERRNNFSQQGMQRQNTDQLAVIFNFEMPLDGEKDYLQQEYPFELSIPANADTGMNNLNPAASVIGQVAENILLGASINSRVTWSVHAKLYIPGKLGLSAKAVQINVS
jgi:hypothetical protein